MKGILVVSAALAIGVTGSAFADERAELERLRETTLSLIQVLVDQGILTKDKAEALIAKAEEKGRAAAASGAGGGVAAGGASAGATSARAGGSPERVRVPYVPETVRNEMRDEIKTEVLAQARAERWGDPGALPEWMDRIRIAGDVRLRYDSQEFNKTNTSATLYPFTVDNVLGTAFAPDLTNTTVDRTRLRLRARLGLQAKVNDETSAVIRVATGTAGDATSTNQTLGGNNANLGKYVILLDQAYVSWSPFKSSSRDWLTVLGGRIPNPWFSTDLVWDEDLSFDGVAATVRPLRGNTFDPFVTLGAFPLRENESSVQDRWLWGAQAGADISISAKTKATFGIALYDFENLAGKPARAGTKGTADYGITEYSKGVRQKGNSLFNIADPTTTDTLYGLASNFRYMDYNGQITFTHFSPVDITLSGNYVNNVGFDSGEIKNRTGLNVAPQTAGYQGRLIVGHPSMNYKGKWQLSMAYRRLERDAVVDAFSDSDWHQGGTNHKGTSYVANFALGPNTWISARRISTSQISGPPLSMDVTYLDFNARF
ncbi:MAG: putative porin [Terrimicrobiaceae bacterium]